jgi:hypothetical protein
VYPYHWMRGKRGEGKKSQKATKQRTYVIYLDHFDQPARRSSRKQRLERGRKNDAQPPYPRLSYSSYAVRGEGGDEEKGGEHSLFAMRACPEGGVSGTVGAGRAGPCGRDRDSGCGTYRCRWELAIYWVVATRDKRKNEQEKAPRGPKHAVHTHYSRFAACTICGEGRRSNGSGETWGR